MPSAEFSADKPIALVGLMGAGKSTVGRRLAERLGLPFADSDAEVEQAEGLTVAEIFERYGEEAFRERERTVIAALSGGPPRVIAAGGGAFVDADSRRLMLDRCTVIWLDADLECLAERTGSDRQRPLLAGQDPRSALAALAEQRRPFYAEAHFRVDAGPKIDQVVERIVASLAGRT